MRSRWRRILGICGALSAATHARAEAPAKPQPTAADALAPYFKAFADKRLIAAESAPVEELRRQLSEAELLAQDGRHEEAVLLLSELTSHPRFAAYADLEEMPAAYYALGGALHALGAEPSARLALRKVLDKGPDERYFAPAFRRYVDVAIALGPTAALRAELEAYGEKLPDDARDELAYVRARQAQQSGELAEAKRHYDQVSKRSRFYANAQYELGALAARERAWDAAERRFCRIAKSADDKHYAFYVDERYFRIKDLARLGLGRVAHERGRGDDAFYYYFQVPNDSPRMAEALFEAAYARYEAHDAEGASDLLDQLEARYPNSTFADEAAVLRGYVALERCDYEAASRYFKRFNAHFTPVLQHLDRLLRNPARRAALYETLRTPEGRADDSHKSAAERRLLTLLRVHPDFERLHGDVAQLDDEAGRSGRLAESFGLLAARYNGAERPRPTAAETTAPVAELRQQLTDARRALRVLTEQLDAMRALGAKDAQLQEHERGLAALALRQRKLEDALASLTRARSARAAHSGAALAESGGAGELTRLLAEDAARAHALDERVLTLRPELLRTANQRALAELKALRERLAGFLRRSRIGRIDAVMGSKRRIERQIETLAAGQFPEELRDPLRVQGFLADDEEYWPFEGEDWPDEYLERSGVEPKPKEAPR